MIPDEFQRNRPNVSRCIGPNSDGNLRVPRDSFLENAQEKEISELKYLVSSLELILNNVYSGIIFCDRKCNIVFMNHVYAELLGVDRNEAVGKSIYEFFPDSRLVQVY